MTTIINFECVHVLACVRHKIRAEARDMNFCALGCESCEFYLSKDALVDVVTIPRAMEYAEDVREFYEDPNSAIPFLYPLSVKEVMERVMTHEEEAE